jgi:hypothetical protein
VLGVKVPVAGAGLKASLLGTTVRIRSIAQITNNGWPLYLWHNDDSKPGEATGQDERFARAVVRARRRWCSGHLSAIALQD